MRLQAISAFCCAALSCAACAALAQTESRTVVFDGLGNGRDWSTVQAGDSRSNETFRNLNGRRVPFESSEEKVIRNEGGVRIVERISRRFDPNGNPLPPEKSVSETTTRPDGSVAEKVTTYRGDINGALQPVERTTAEIRKAGNTTQREMAIERKTLNGGFETVERRIASEAATKDASERNETTYARDANGRFVEAWRTVVKATISGNEVREQTDEYDAATTGQLQLARQAIARTVKDPSGVERREVDVFGPAAQGRPIDANSPAQLRERQIFTTRPSSDGTVIQVYSVQRPTLNSSRELEPPRKVSETVCKGKCQ
ncbi:MAG: hypothetical protein IPP47_26680 [Bryobacterales bacterium]|nr:hypothetical protein [Bryobacterales bacterium]